MMKTKRFVTFTFMFTLTQLTFAHQVNCQFTEPFINLELPAGKQLSKKNLTAKIINFNQEKTVKVLAAIESKSKIAYLLDVEGFISMNKVIVDKSKNGNDGMSDEVYQAEGLLGSFEDATQLYGGCNIL